MENLKEKLKSFSLPVSPSTLIILGYIFAVFGTLIPDKRKLGIILFVVTFAGHILYLFSPEQKGARLLSRAKAYLDRGKSKEGAEALFESAKLNQDRDNLSKLFGGRCKNPASYKKAAVILEKKIPQLDTPYFRLIVGAMYYYVGNVKKAVEILSKIPEEKRDIKTVRLLGSCLFDLGRYKESIDVLKEFDPLRFALTQDELAIQFGIGIALAKLGNLQGAIEYLERVEAKNARFGNVSEILERLRKEAGIEEE